MLDVQIFSNSIPTYVSVLSSHVSRDPVSPDEAEDYLDIISCPMDLTTMQNKFKSSQYRGTSDFLEDIKLIFSNAEEYNQPSSDVLILMSRTEEAFIELLQKSLPGVSYLRRRTRKRLVTPSDDDDEDDDHEEKRQNGKHSRSRQRDDEYDSGRRKTRNSNGKGNETESEEDEDEEAVRRKSKRTVRKDYREQDSDNERDTKRSGLRRTSKVVTYEKDGSSDEDSVNQRHSKRLKRSWRPRVLFCVICILYRISSHPAYGTEPPRTLM